MAEAALPGMAADAGFAGDVVASPSPFISEPVQGASINNSDVVTVAAGDNLF